jgi:SCP-2 sterol transfer family
VFQFRFRGADPWHLVIENGSSRVEPGDVPHADLTLETDWEQWIGISMRGESPLRAVARKRLRPRGSLRGLRAFAKAFVPRSVA